MGRKIGAKASGFTLVELIVTIGIIAVLATIGKAQYKRFVFKARQSEAVSGLAYAVTMAKALLAEDGTFPIRSDGSNCTPDGGPGTCLLNDYFNVGNCDFEDPLGFTKNCSAKYYFRLNYNVLDHRRFYIEAHEVPLRAFCADGTWAVPRERRMVNWCGKKCFQTALDPDRCLEIAGACGDPMSCP